MCARYSDKRVWNLGGKCNSHSHMTLTIKAVNQQENLRRVGDIIQTMLEVQNSTEPLCIHSLRLEEVWEASTDPLEPTNLQGV